MNTTTTDTPRTDACESTPDRGGIRARTWKVTRLVETARSLERENARLRAALEAAADALAAAHGGVARFDGKTAAACRAARAALSGGAS